MLARSARAGSRRNAAQQDCPGRGGVRTVAAQRHRGGRYQRADRSAAMSATAVDTGRAGRVARLGRELEVMRLRLAVSRVVTRDVSQWVNDDDAVLDVIVDDVMRRWLARSAEEPAVLDGPDGFWSRYANRVEWAPAERRQRVPRRVLPGQRE